jgi:hypothetical protein
MIRDPRAYLRACEQNARDRNRARRRALGLLASLRLEPTTGPYRIPSRLLSDAATLAVGLSTDPTSPRLRRDLETLIMCAIVYRRAAQKRGALKEIDPWQSDPS